MPMTVMDRFYYCDDVKIDKIGCNVMENAESNSFMRKLSHTYYVEELDFISKYFS